MNYYAPRRRKEGGLWHYTCMNDGAIWPVGYCADACPGHADTAGAYAHYREYLLAERTRYDGALVNEQKKCQECGEWTQGVVEIEGVPRFILCDAHRTPEVVGRLFKVGDAISSF